MKWKIALGLGLACAACCAVPVMIGAGGLGLLGLASGNAIAIAVGGALIAATAMAYGIQRRRATQAEACPIDGTCGCKPEGMNQ